jgi:hypothetical protein
VGRLRPKPFQALGRGLELTAGRTTTDLDTHEYDERFLSLVPDITGLKQALCATTGWAVTCVQK